MKNSIAVAIIGLLVFITNIFAYSEFTGTVYKGDGTDTTAGYATVKCWGSEGDYKETGANASGGYGLWPLAGNQYYELYAEKTYPDGKWMDAAWNIWLGYPELKEHDFHLHPGYPPKK